MIAHIYSVRLALSFHRRCRAPSHPALHAFGQPRIGILLFLQTHPTTRFEGFYGLPCFLIRRAGRGNASATLPVNRDDRFGEVRKLGTVHDGKLS